MPKLTFDKKEILAEGKSRINNHGAAHISRKHKGKEFVWVILKEQGSNTSAPEVTDCPAKAGSFLNNCSEKQPIKNSN